VTFDGNTPLAITVTSGVSPWKTTVNSNSPDNYTFNSSGSGIAGPGNLEKSGTSILTLTGANTYSGQTIVSGGTLAFAAANSLGNAGAANTIAISGGARLSYTAATALDLGATRSIAVGAGGGSISHNNATAANITISGELSGSDNLSLHSNAAGAGTFILTGINSGYTGNLSVDAQSTWHHRFALRKPECHAGGRQHHPQLPGCRSERQRNDA
jgi:autotransporter-associated beta strand protein